jgi:hypothetical protein
VTRIPENDKEKGGAPQELAELAALSDEGEDPNHSVFSFVTFSRRSGALKASEVLENL